MDIHCRKST